MARVLEQTQVERLPRVDRARDASGENPAPHHSLHVHRVEVEHLELVGGAAGSPSPGLPCVGQEAAVVPVPVVVVRHRHLRDSGVKGGGHHRRWGSHTATAPVGIASPPRGVTVSGVVLGKALRNTGAPLGSLHEGRAGNALRPLALRPDAPRREPQLGSNRPTRPAPRRAAGA